MLKILLLCAAQQCLLVFHCSGRQWYPPSSSAKESGIWSRIQSQGKESTHCFFCFFCGLEYAGGSVYVAGCGAKSVVVWGALKQPRYLSLSLHLFLSLLLSLSLPIPLTPLSLLILYVIPIDFLLLDTQSVDNFCLSSLSFCPPSCHGFMSRWGPGKDGP